MNITKVSYSRKFSLGNYETLDLSVEAALNEKDNPLEVWNILADNTEMWYISEKNKKEKSASTAPTTTTSAPATQQPKEQARNIDILKEFTEEQENRLTAKREGNAWIITPKQFLGTEMFAQISATIRSLHGEYISAGKDSHWRVPT